MTAIRFVHAGDISTSDAHKLVWNVGEMGCRYQEVAIAGDRVIGSWTYDLEWLRGRARIHSGRTDVTQRFRRKGIARALWFAAVARWNPTRIESTIATDEGRDFLARMTVELAYHAPDLFLWVKTREEDKEVWEELCGWAARSLLQNLGKRDRARAVEAKPLKLIKGAAA